MNNVTIIGNLTRDAKEVGTSSGKTLIFVNVAVNYTKGEKRYTDYIPVKILGSSKLAAVLKKGKKVAVTGRLQSYKDKKGVMQLIVAAQRVEFLSKKGIETEPNGDVTPPPQEVIAVEDEPF